MHDQQIRPPPIQKSVKYIHCIRLTFLITYATPKCTKKPTLNCVLKIRLFIGAQVRTKTKIT